MRFAVIDGETVVNVIEAEPGFTLDGFKLIASKVAGPGWTYKGGKFTAPDPVPAPTNGFTYKADIWRRCTDDEFVMLKAALDAAPPRQRQIFADATRLVHDDPDFVTLRAGVVAAVGEERADQLLADSEG